MKLLSKVTMWSVIGFAATLSAQPVDPPAGTTGTDSKATARVPLLTMQTQVRSYKERTTADGRHVQNLQARARKDKDVIKLNCINDKLVQLKPELNIADRLYVQLMAASDADESRHAAYDDYAKSVEAVRQLREEADRCAGEGIDVDSENTFTAPDMPDDPFQDPFGTIVEPPGYASPYS
jgi:hypothetical protein